MCKAGGDWEYPVMYFKIEFKSQYGIKNNKYESNPKYVWDLKIKNSLYNQYVLIPPVEAGNSLIKTKNGWRAYQDEDVTKENKKEVKISDDDKLKAWKWLEKTIEDVVEERHEMLN